jgi:uncharacterized protein (DUF1800 family)
MPNLDPYTSVLSEKMASHLLRRATFGPTKQDIINFTGITAADAVNQLISNSDFIVPEPVDLDINSSSKGEPYLSRVPYEINKNFYYTHYIRLWWVGIMARQTPTSILDKLTLFWQNHFVTNVEIVNEYKFEYSYIDLLRKNALGNFKYLVKEITKNAAMLVFLNGNQNVKGEPNENYARELQELFVVGEKDFYGNPNYEENDVKEAAKVLTGWKTNAYGALPHGTYFSTNNHDESDKLFSSHYGNNVIVGRSGLNAGELELNDLVSMLLNHQESAKFICRKLYRWFVNPNVTENIELNIIIPLATFFASPANNFEIEPVVRKLLTSQHFYEESNIGSMVKSPFDLIIGSMRFFNFPVPQVSPSDVSSYFNYVNFCFYLMENMQMEILKQPSVFGYEPYYQPGYSKIWINSSTLGRRNQFVDAIIYGGNLVNANYNIKIDLFNLASSATVPNNANSIVEQFTKFMFTHELSSVQKMFLVNNIMMQGLPLTTWQFEYNAFISDPNNIDKRNAVEYRLQTLMRYILKLAEFQIC